MSISDRYLDTLEIPEGFEGLTKPYFDVIDNGYFFDAETKVRMGPFRSMLLACQAVEAHIADKLKQRAVAATNARLALDKLHPQVAEAFDLLQEECGEIIQARSKLRRGREEMSFKPPKRRPDGPDNITDMKAEIMDVMVLIDYLIDHHNLITAEEYAVHSDGKVERLKRYTNLYEPVGAPDWIDRLDADFTTDPDYQAIHGATK